MSIMCPAIDGVGKEVLIIRDNVVIGEGRCGGMRGNEFASISLIGDAQKMIPTDHELVKMLGYKHATIRYCPISGHFIGMGCLLEEHESLDHVFEDTMVVDKFNFRWGMVPDHFMTVAGYRAAITEDDE